MKPEQWAVIGVIVGAILGGVAQGVSGLIEDRLTRTRAGRDVRRGVYQAFVGTTEAYYRQLLAQTVARVKPDFDEQAQ